MRKTGSTLAAMAAALLFALAAGPAAADPKFVGVKKCRTCHKAKTGDQYGKWLKARHSQAYKTLATDKAKKMGKAAGVENPQEDPKCLECHVTGRNVKGAEYGSDFAKEDGVQCESCHGPGEKYKSLKIMSKKVYEKDRAAAHKAALAAGLQIPTEQTCKKCHNPRSPGYKEFHFAKFWDKIKHCNPKKESTAVKTGKVCP